MGKALAQHILTWFPKTHNDLRDSPGFEDDFRELYWNEKKFLAIAHTAMKHAKRQFFEKSAGEVFHHRFMHPQTFYFAELAYYDPIFSAKALCKVIFLQCFEQIELAKDFISKFMLVLNKEVPKRNTFLMVSPPSSGKTWVVNSCLDNFWAVGGIQNTKKGGSNFTYQDGVGMRVNLWNECILQEKAAIETAKQVWEGDRTSVQVKHEKNTFLYRTPLFVTANNVPWTYCKTEEKAFLDRCYFYKWTPQPWLLKMGKYPCPLAWHIIMANYTSDEWWNEIQKLGIDQLIEEQDDHSYESWLKDNVTPDEWKYLNKV